MLLIYLYVLYLVLNNKKNIAANSRCRRNQLQSGYNRRFQEYSAIIARVLLRKNQYMEKIFPLCGCMVNVVFQIIGS